jgi:hypothetical protein
MTPERIQELRSSCIFKEECKEMLNEIERLQNSHSCESTGIPVTDYCDSCAAKFESEKQDRLRLDYLRRHAKYARPVEGIFNGAHQVTITAPPLTIMPADFMQAIDEAMEREKGNQ